MKTQAEAVWAIEQYGNMVRRIVFMQLKNYADVEDVFQDVFLKYVLHNAPFESDAHEKAWLIRVSINTCRDLLKSFFKRRVCSLEDVDIEPFTMQPEDGVVLDAVLRLPDKYKIVIYLHYFEGYSAVEIAEIMDKSENTIYTWLSRGKQRLKETLGGDFFA